jgi:hypothetical protein
MENNIVTFCRRHGIESPFERERITSGRNSEVWRLFNDKGQWILKNYHQNPGDLRDRLGTEFRFLSFLSKHNISCVPAPIGMDSQKKCALYSYLPGKRPEKITEWHIKLAASFIKIINQYKNEEGAKGLMPASEACFSIREHLDLVNRRIASLIQVSHGQEIGRGGNDFIRKLLIPSWENIKKRVVDGIPPIEIDAPINRTSWILSPSDFGFHNTLEHDGKLSFIDFEYAGWDDPSKLLCDFACQPEVPASKAQAELFVNELIRDFPEGEAIASRISFLLPVHRLKWCCIFLNEFLPVNLQRRRHAGKDDKNLLSEQLEKAKNYFNKHIIN